MEMLNVNGNLRVFSVSEEGRKSIESESKNGLRDFRERKKGLLNQKGFCVKALNCEREKKKTHKKLETHSLVMLVVFFL
jgi:hypothetical protein